MIDEYLARIRDLDPQIRAWVEVAPQPPLASGPLDGVPFGVKDIFETRGLATEYGSPLYAGRKGDTDAALVTMLRRRGAILLGKTQTTAFAYYDPAPTRNPRNVAHTPGGSSSGSAAAVAAGMVPFALGTQTQGSIIRPASYCGICGFKPTYGLLPLAGALPFAPSLDTAGLFAPTSAEMRWLWEKTGYPIAAEPPRVMAYGAGLNVEPPMQAAYENALARLRAAGIRLNAVDLSEEYAVLLAAVRVINAYEGARTHEERYRRHGVKIGMKLAQLVEEGLRIPSEMVLAAIQRVSESRERAASLFAQYPVVLTPAATGPAPLGLESTGDPRMNSPWTALGVPAVSVPMPAEGLPLGLQVTAAAGHDAAALSAACTMAGTVLG